MGIIVVVVIGVGFVFGVLAVMDGQLHIDWFLVVGSLFVFGALSLFSHKPNNARDINGEIETRLSGYEKAIARLNSRNRYDPNAAAELANVKSEKARFENTIEYGVVTDGLENYYSYKGER